MYIKSSLYVLVYIDLYLYFYIYFEEVVSLEIDLYFIWAKD